MPKFIELDGHRYGRLTVVSRNNDLQNRRRFNCVCDCGRTTVVAGSNLRNGHTTSCGCYQSEKRAESHTTHGHLKGNNRHPLYATWCEMRHRCNSPTHKQFQDYGGRGIVVCDEWQGKNGFTTFLTDMGERPPGYSIDRIDNDLGYTKGNCRWACNITQANNTRQCRSIQAFGESHTISGWSRKTGIGKATIRFRIDKMHLPPEIALSPKSMKAGTVLVLNAC